MDVYLDACTASSTLSARQQSLDQPGALPLLNQADLIPERVLQQLEWHSMRLLCILPVLGENC